MRLTLEFEMINVKGKCVGLVYWQVWQQVQMQVQMQVNLGF